MHVITLPYPRKKMIGRLWITVIICYNLQQVRVSQQISVKKVTAV